MSNELQQTVYEDIGRILTPLIGETWYSGPSVLRRYVGHYPWLYVLKTIEDAFSDECGPIEEAIKSEVFDEGKWNDWS
ncbi:MAG: hypothetical protein LBT97_03125 [Planctomycetota bacterium]|jgi:hypothetical protein|nr:hypothetical protein [Planctomycetota bacterium]